MNTLPIGNTVVSPTKYRAISRGVASQQTQLVDAYIKKQLNINSTNKEVYIVRYPNRKMYMYAIKSYISLGDVSRLIAAGFYPKVTLKKNNEDFTEDTLLHTLVQLGGLGEAELRALIIKALSSEVKS